MSTFAEYTKKKKKEQESAKGTSFTDYTKTELGIDDIAPITTVAPTFGTSGKANNRTWFQQSKYFDDGYDFGDITKTILGSGTDLLENLGTGIIGMGEKALDGLAMVGNAMNKSQMNQNAQNELIHNALTGKNTKENAEGVLKKYDKWQKEAEKGTVEFVKKDLYDEEKVAKQIITAPIKEHTGIDAETDSIFGEKSDALVQSGGQLLATAGLNALGVPWFLTTGATSFGSQSEVALNEGATYEEAFMSATVSAGAEILTEKLSGGIKFGGKTLDDVLLKPLINKISNKAGRLLVNTVADAVGEGGEEIASSFFSNLGTALYKEEDLGEILASEEALDEYLESFIGGAVLGGVSSGVKAVANRNAIELTDDEQKVFDKVVEDRIAEAETDGKTLTEREKKNIRKSVLNDLLKGYISTDTIESVLGGETYKSYKDTIDNETALQEEFKTLNKMKQGEMTGEQTDRRAELKQMLEDLKNNSNREQLKSQLSDEVFNLVKGSRLVESYNETARRGQTFEADLTKYNGKAQEVVKKAVESGILNNTNRTHEFVDMVAKLSADKGVLFEFANNEKIKESGFAVEGKTVNGYKTDDGNIAVNIDSKKALNSVVGHEITHILEGTELYSALADVVQNYATTKGEYQERMASLRKLYTGVYKGEDFDQKIREELTADIVGDYLFTDTEFINRLSTENRNVFQKIYDEIKYLCKIATAGSKEARELERVKRAFEKAYKESANTKAETDTEVTEDTHESNTKYSLVTDEDAIAFLENQDYVVTYKAMQVIDGKLYPPMSAEYKVEEEYTNKKGEKKVRTVKKLKQPSELGKWQQSEENVEVAKQSYDAKKGYSSFELLKGDGKSLKGVAYNPYEHTSNIVLNDQFSSAHRRDNLVTVEYHIPVSELTSGYKAEYSKDAVGKRDWHTGLVASNLKNTKRDVYLTRWSKPVRVLSDTEVAQKYKEILDKEDGVTVPWNVVTQSLREELEKAGVPIDYSDKKIGTATFNFEASLRGEYLENKKNGKSKANAKYSLSEKQQEYFKDSVVRDDNGNLKVMYHGTSKGGHTVFDTYGSNYGLFGQGSYFTDNKSVAESYTNKGKGNNKQVYETYLNITNPLDMDAQGNIEEWQKAFPDADFSNCNTNEEFYRAVEEFYADQMMPKWEVAEEIKDTIAFKMGYDGITHIGGGRVNADGTRHQVYIAFEPEQIKNIDNIAPTKDADIRFSLSKSVEETKDLVAVHNLSEEKLLKSLKLGGLPMPSIAIIKAKNGHNDFGDISLVFDKSTIDPKSSKYNKVFTSDAYTPTYPHIDYKIDSDVVDKGVDEVERLIKSKGYGKDAFGYLSSISEDSFKYGNTEEVANKLPLKVAYLIDKGIDFTPIYEEKQYSMLGRFDNYVVKHIADALGKERINELHNNSEGVKNAVEEIRTLASEHKANKYKDKPDLFKALKEKPFYGENNFGFSQAHEIVEGAYNYFNYGTQTEINEWETSKEIKSLIDNDDYRKWVDNLFDGFVEKEGIRNNVDLFTPSGNRRSFEALHWEHNLENVVKSMRTGLQQGKALFGASIYGASQSELKSINDIKNESNRLVDIYSEESKEAYREKRKELESRFTELVSSIVRDNGSNVFIAMDDASAVLVESVLKCKTKTAMDNYIKRELEGWGNYSNTLADDLMDIVNELRALPTGYFEAKPQRAVELNEIATAIVPDSTSTELKTLLNDNGIKYVEYENGNDQARTDILNSLDKVRFSLSSANEQHTSNLDNHSPYAPTFYSQMGRVVDGIKQEKIGASSVVNYLKGKGVKNEEIKWSGIEEWLEGKKSVTKEELQEFVANNHLEIEEELLGGDTLQEFITEWQRLVDLDLDIDEIPTINETFYNDTKNYLLELVEDEEIESQDADHLIKLLETALDEGTRKPTNWHDYKLDGGSNYREILFKMPNSHYYNDSMMTHWKGKTGVLAHARVQDFVDNEGKKVLFIEEIQSDWHNEGAKQGYQDEKLEAKKSLLAEKEARFKELDDKIFELKDQVKNGEITQDDYRDITETFRKEYTNLYIEVDNLREEVKQGKKLPPDAPFKDNYHEFVLKNLLREATEKGYDKIAWTTGKMQEERWSSEYAEGYRIEYDQDIPSFLNKYGKKWGARVGVTSFGVNANNEHQKQVINDKIYNLQKEIETWLEDLDGDVSKEYEAYIKNEVAYKEQQIKELEQALKETKSIEVHSLDITDSMKQSVLYEGQPFYSLSREGEQPKEYGNFNTYAKDILLQPDIAPVKETVTENTTVVEDAIPDGFAPLTEEEAQEMFENDRERFNALTDADAPPVVDTEHYNIADTTRLDKKTLNNISAILKESLSLNKAETKAIQDIVQNYSTSEFPSRTDLFNEIKDRFGEKAWTERNEEVANVKQFLKAYKILVSPTIKGDIADYSDFMRRNFGKITFSKNGTPVDTAYMELSATYPEYFPPDIENATDQLLRMSEVANMDIKNYLTEVLDDETIQEATDIIADIVNTHKENAIRQSVENDGKAYFKHLEESEGLDDIAPTREFEAIKPRPEKLVGEEEQWAKNKMARADKVKGNAEQQTAKIITNEPKVEKKKNRAWSKFVSNFVDKASPFETLALKTGNREVDAKYNTIRYAEGKAQNLIGKGTEGVKALNDIIADVENDGLTESLYEYLYHKHNVDRMTLENRYKDVPNKAVFGDSVTAKVSQDIVDQYEFAEPKLVEYANEIYNYNRHLRKMLVDGGVISQETADLWEEMYPHYVPIRRVGDEGLNVNVPLDTGRTGVNAPIKRATGGSRDILPLFDTMAQRTIQTYKAIAKNRFGVELKNTLGTTVENAETNLDEVIDSIDTQDSLLQEGKNGRNPTFTVFENGEKVTFEITEEMYDALKPTSEGLAYTNKPLNTINNIRRGLLTEYNPTFLLTNAVKDAQDVLINSQHPVQTYKNFPKAIKELATKGGRWYNEYMENGGEQNTYFEKETNTFAKEKSGIAKIVGMPLEKIGDANNFIERIPRLAEYIASRESGRSIDVAMLDSARVTTNFSAGGDVTKLFNRNGVTFLNASVQGAVQQVRNVREAKYNGLKGWTQLVAKTLVAGLPAMLLNGILWDDDEEYEELSDYVKENYYIVAKFGDGQFVRIPKGRTVAVIQNAFEQIRNALTGDDEVDLKRFLELAISNLAPNNPLDNNIIAPIKQAIENKTWYGEDLVPTRLQDLPDAEQYDESTDAISKWLGEKLDYSPYKINYLLDQYSGGVGDMFLPMLTPEAESGDNSLGGNLLAPLKSKFTTDSVMNNQTISDFYKTSNELTTNAKSSKATDEDILKYKYFNSVQTELSDLYAEKREIQNSNLSDEIKYKKVREIQEEINSIAENSLNTYGTVNIDGNYAYVGDRHYRVNDDGEWEKISDKQLAKQEEVTSGLGITPAEYWNNKKEYDYAYESPEKYAVAKAVGGYDAYKTYSSELYDIKADKDKNGKSISGSRKEKVIAYVNELDIDYGARLILFKSEYNADDTYNYEIIDYLNSRDDISYEEEVIILKELGFTVDANGNISW